MKRSYFIHLSFIKIPIFVISTCTASWLTNTLLINHDVAIILWLLAADKEDTMSKFFTYEDRLNLQKKLKESMSIKAIATDLGKNPTTISREIKKYSSEIATGYPGYPFNECKNRFNCRNKNICGKDCL